MVLEIEQTFLSLRCCGYVRDKRGEGFCASLLSNEHNTAFKLVYSYQTFVGADAEQGDEHKGTVILDLIPDEPPRLEGLYFNGRKGPEETSKGGGDIKVALVSRKLRRCFSEA